MCDENVEYVSYMVSIHGGKNLCVAPAKLDLIYIYACM